MSEGLAPRSARSTASLSASRSSSPIDRHHGLCCASSETPSAATIVEVSRLGVKLDPPHASLVVRPVRNHPVEPEVLAGACSRQPRVATAVRDPASQDETSQAEQSAPRILRRAVAAVARLAERLDPYEAGGFCRGTTRPNRASESGVCLGVQRNQPHEPTISSPGLMFLKFPAVEFPRMRVRRKTFLLTMRRKRMSSSVVLFGRRALSRRSGEACISQGT